MMSADSFQMNSLTGKKILSYLRKGNWAHAGEAEAILKTMAPFPKNKHRSLLDVGCGIGGTAQFICDHGWGQVVGIDIDQENIQYAQHQYPTFSFHAIDVVDVPKLLHETFDLIYLFNAFYAFADQVAALNALKAVTKQTSVLVIFDYVCYHEYPSRDNFVVRLAEENFSPTCSFDQLLQKTGWHLIQSINLDAEYKRWYADLLCRFQSERKSLISQFGEEITNRATDKYKIIYQALEQGHLGGRIFYLTLNAKVTRV